MKEKDPIRYTVIGDSIGRGSGAETPGQKWFKVLERRMFSEHGIRMSGSYIVQSGATSFEGLYRLSQFENSGKSDLVFIIFGENDRKYMKAKDFSVIYESLIRKAKAVYPKAEIMTITESCLTSNDFAAEIDAISDHYHASHIDMRPVFQKTGLSAAELTKDLVHPNGRGYQLYADAIYQQLTQDTIRKKEIAAIVDPIHEDTYENYESISSFQRKEGFIIKDGYMTSGQKGSQLEAEFYGNALGVNLLRSPDGGEIKVYIDGKFVTSMSTWWPFASERNLYIANGLSNGVHTVRFEVSGGKSHNNISNDSMTRISSIIVSKSSK
ncbi:SGNH/GDSL hydrolase family protein [Peribacillus cavernae]|uniref:SGNH/GDSL hydrolase family protein n=2 Tax=Peribacillus cavernae TaxID=1674310 RepID=A0A433HX07_9BACI|nr:SGNH/GDSL hydrolase family protein [Peribacillus cavernae]